MCTPFELLKLRKQVASASGYKAISSVKVMQDSTTLISKLLPCYTPDMRAWNNTVGILSNVFPKHVDIVGALKQYPWMLTGSGRPPLASEVARPRDIISLEGWNSLWKGLRPGIARDCVFGGIFFSTWQFLHIAMLNWKAIDINPPPRSINEVDPISPLASSLAAGFSGTMAAAASHTFDTAKTRSQCIVTPKYIAMERKLLKWSAPGIWIERVAGMSPADRNIMFRGIWLRMARSGIASFSIVGSYLLALDRLF
ncbi:mitochondrial carrier protein MTM1 isoform X2 [Asparagus officinalis]|nr:mitochondrial carrier protein MTM1 isoform X2 [Asparagus officinalis]